MVIWFFAKITVTLLIGLTLGESAIEDDKSWSFDVHPQSGILNLTLKQVDFLYPPRQGLDFTRSGCGDHLGRDCIVCLEHYPEYADRGPENLLYALWLGYVEVSKV